MPDIKIKRYADKENLKKLMKYSKDIFATKTELASKANDSDVAHKSGDETIAGTKTFPEPIVGSVTGSSGSCTGNAATATTAGAVSTTIAADGAKDLVYASMASNDAFRIRCGGGDDNGYVEIATSDNGNEPIYVRQYYKSDGELGSFTSVARTLTLLDENGNTQLPGTVTAPTFSGNLNGNCSGTAGSVAWNNVSGKPSAFTPYFANGTWYSVGDDAAIGDHNVSGGLGVKALNSTTTRIDLCYKDDASNYKSITYDGTTLYMNGNCDYATNSGSCTGNAASATKLATAHTIALSGAATGTATAFDGSANITIPVTALSPSAIRAQWYAAYPDGPEAHNAMWGGRDLTTAFESGAFSESIADGTFKDIFPGDYITKQVTISGTAYTVTWVIADCDYWINKGDTTAHHVAIVPQTPIFNAWMNPTNTAEGGYAGSEMYRNVIPACATGIVNAFGSDHILTFGDYLTRDLNTAAISSGITTFTGAPNWEGEWHSQECNLMSEAMVYDGPHCASSALDNVMATRQMSAFRLSEGLIYNRQNYWLRDVGSSSAFANIHTVGAHALQASASGGVRPFALLR